MADFALQCISITMSIAIAIIFVYAGIKLLSRVFNGKQISHGTIKTKNFLDESKLVDIRLTDGKSIEGVKFLGFSEFGEHKDLPHHFKSWVVLESENGRTYIKPESIRIISTSTVHDA